MRTKRKKVCGIYIITNNLNGMSYVGQSKNCMKRLTEHKTASIKRPIDKAINEIGVENFTFKIEKECLPEELDYYERETIKKYDTIWPNGYNRRGGGRNEYNSVCEETKRKMGESKKGEKNPMYGNHKSLCEEHRRKISNTKKNAPKPKWLTPESEIREMSAHMVSHWHKDWIRLTEE